MEPALTERRNSRETNRGVGTAAGDRTRDRSRRRMDVNPLDVLVAVCSLAGWSNYVRHSRTLRDLRHASGVLHPRATRHQSRSLVASRYE